MECSTFPRVGHEIAIYEGGYLRKESRMTMSIGLNVYRRNHEKDYMEVEAR